MRSNVGFKVLLGIVAVLAIAASSCSTPPPGVFADILWRVRCEEMRMCTSYPDRSIYGFDRESSQRISCAVTETASNRILTFNASYNGAGGAYSLSLRNATFPRSGGTPAGAGCEVSVLEDNSYIGACGAMPPSEAQPCQVSNVSFGSDADGRTVISGNIYCVGISPTAAPTINREVTAQGADPSAATMPLTFTIYDCEGFTPD